MQKVFFTADDHFGHTNIIRHCKRPFRDAYAMDQALEDAWNAPVGPDDVVYHLSDFTLQGWLEASNYFARLNGRIKVLRNISHHDKRWLEMLRNADSLNCAAGWPVSASGHPIELMEPQITLEIDGKVIVLNHFPMASWDRKHRGAWHLYAHTHGRFEDVGLMMDVGVDAVSKYGLPPYAPVPLNAVRKIMQRRIEKNGSWDRLSY